MISVSPEHGRAWRSYVLAALNRQDDGTDASPAPFASVAVQWSDRDNPKIGDLYCLLRELSFVTLGTERIVENEGASDVRIRHRTVGEWTCTVQVVSRQAGEKSLAAGAHQYLGRVRKWLMSDLTDAMRDIGLVPLRIGSVQSIPRLAFETQWETRASLDVTFGVSQIVTERPERIEAVGSIGTIEGPPDPDLEVSIDVDATP